MPTELSYSEVSVQGICYPWTSQPSGHRGSTTAPDVVYGMFLVNGNTALVLFDSGATYSYISSKFAREHDLPVTPREKPIITSSPLGDLKCTHICKGVSLTIEGLIFEADLTLLPSTSLDVILGMDWLTIH